MNHRHEIFCKRIACGEEAVTVYRDLYPRCAEKSLSVQASRMLGKANIASRVQQLREENAVKMTESCFLSASERRRMLADMARVSIADVLFQDGSVDMEKLKRLPAWCIQKLKITTVERTSRDGSVDTATKVEIAIPDRIQAITLDSTLAGDEIAPPENKDEKIQRAHRMQRLLRSLPGHGGHLIRDADSHEQGG